LVHVDNFIAERKQWKPGNMESSGNLGEPIIFHSHILEFAKKHL